MEQHNFSLSNNSNNNNNNANCINANITNLNNNFLATKINVKQIACGQNHSIILLNDDSIYGTG